MMENNRVYVVDDNKDFLESTVWMLEGEGYQVESFSNPATLLSQLSKEPDQNDACILMDVRMPKMSGLDLHDQLINNKIDIPVIYMTGHADISLAVEAMKKGAVTFIEKPLENDELEDALDAAFIRAEKQAKKANDNPLNNTTAQFGEEKNEYIERLASLTPREKDVADGIVSGKLNKVIAYDLGISIKTVELHRSRVMAKMQAKNAANLVKMVITESII